MTKASKKSTTKTVSTPANDDPIDLHDIVLLSEQWCNSDSNKPAKVFSNDLVQSIYDLHLRDNSENTQHFIKSNYCENYLLPSLTSDSSTAHFLSILIILNEKLLCSSFSYLFPNIDDKINTIFDFILFKFPSDALSLTERTTVVTFLVSVIQSFDIEPVRNYWLKYFSLPIWKTLSPERLRKELTMNPQLERHWYHLVEKDDQETSEGVETSSKKRKGRPSKGSSSKKLKPDPHLEMESQWFPSVLDDYLLEIQKLPDDFANARARYIEKLCEFFIDLISQLPTRRFVHSLLDDRHLYIRSRKWNSSNTESFSKILSQYKAILSFAIDNQTGKCLSPEEIIGASNQELQKLQQVAYVDYKESLSDLIFSSTGELGKEENMRKFLSLASHDCILDLTKKMGYISSSPRSTESFATEFLVDLLVDKLCFKSREDQHSLFPTENMLWSNEVSFAKSDNKVVIPLPKLNLQFLSLSDYLSRNFTLYGLESTFQLRHHIESALRRVAPRKSLAGSITFGGLSPIARPLLSFRMEEVVKPDIGETFPARVTCSFEVDLSPYQGAVRDEWENLHPNDVLFLVSIQNPSMEVGNQPSESDLESLETIEDPEFCSKYGVKFVRTGEVFEIRDEDGVVLNDLSKPDERSSRIGVRRKIKLNLDSIQYYHDMKNGVECYESLNLVVRRHPRENNFKSVLNALSNLQQSPNLERLLPIWLKDILIGYGNPSASYYRNMPIPTELKEQNDSDIEVFNYFDTFCDLEHIKEAFPGHEVVVSDSSSNVPPFRLSIRRSASKDSINVNSYRLNSSFKSQLPGALRYTPSQVEAIRSGVNHGLSLIVGPPGTGKTEVAKQIVSTLYHNFPSQRILIVTQSNHALNDLFGRLLKTSINPGHILRLGHGEKDLVVSDLQEYSKIGRVNWSLSRRQDLLNQVQRLASSLNIVGDVGYSCETAEYFAQEHIQTRIKRYNIELQQLKDTENTNSIESIFPFKQYFPALNFTGDIHHDELVANDSIESIQNMFVELTEYRPYELLRTQHQRTDYFLATQARVIAMTSTHAAIMREKLLKLGFKYDSIIVEEASQMLEVETLIPMFLQNVETLGGPRLKRVVLIGDNHQLPPIVNHPILQEYSHFTQSMFSRFLRLGVPFTQLDKQGRTRPEIAKLFGWRYATDLGNLPLVEPQSGSASEAFNFQNPGFLHCAQFINVLDFQGKGEQVFSKNSFQNFGEAEYVVAVYQYMRLLGYPANKITILTAYNGQKKLITDIISQRCKKSIFGYPHVVTTIDSYQGQYNDYVLVSLVRTTKLGYLADIRRRLISAMSRAKLGLYVFYRKELFQDCIELSPLFRELPSNSKLQLVKHESFYTHRSSNDSISAENILEIDDVTAMGLKVYEMTLEASKK